MRDVPEQAAGVIAVSRLNRPSRLEKPSRPLCVSALT
jgi:hypothetical protein